MVSRGEANLNQEPCRIGSGKQNRPKATLSACFFYIWYESLAAFSGGQPRYTSGKSLMSSSSPSFTETTAVCPGSTSLLVPYW